MEREAWQGAGGGKKYKSETGKLKNFSWNEPTEGKGGSTCICTVMFWKKYHFCEQCLLLLDCFFDFWCPQNEKCQPPHLKIYLEKCLQLLSSCPEH